MRKALVLSMTTAPAFTALGGEFLADAPAGGEEGDLHAGEAVVCQFFDRVRLPFELGGLAGAAR